MTREPLADGSPDTSCPDCGEDTENLVGGARCTECSWWEKW